MGPVLYCENLYDSSGIECIRCQTVHGFRRNSNKLAGFKKLASLYNILTDRRDNYFAFLLRTFRAAARISFDVRPNNCINSSGSPDPPNVSLTPTNSIGTGCSLTTVSATAPPRPAVI